MAYADQELKKRIEPKVKEILAKYGLKGRMGVRNHMVLTLKIPSGKLDFIGSFNRVAGALPRHENNPFVPVKYIDVNRHHYKDHFDGKELECCGELVDAMMVGNHDKSDISTDYFDVGFYIDIHIGTWDKPYELTA